MEIYKVFFELYEISNLGNIRRKTKMGTYKPVKGSISSRGYRRMDLRRDGNYLVFMYHQVVAKEFLGDCPEGLQVDHIDRNRLNNNVNNLRYVTPKENMCNTSRYRIDLKGTDKERTLARQREYEAKNKERFANRKKKAFAIYYQQIKEKLSEKIQCPCGEIISRRCLKRHEIRGPHKKWLASNQSVFEHNSSKSSCKDNTEIA